MKEDKKYKQEQLEEGEEEGEEEEEEIDPLENPNWQLYAFKSPIHTTASLKDEFMAKN